MPKKLLKISEFAALSGISRKLLIFYDKNGILHPQIIDKENGYRYYSYRQIDTASVIVSLREAGMSLDSIRKYIANKSPQKLIKILGQQEEALQQQIKNLNLIKAMVRTRIKQTQKGLKEKEGIFGVEWQPAENLFCGPELPNDYDLTDGWTYLPHFYDECKKQGIQLGFTVGTMISQENLRQKLWSKPCCYFYRLPENQYPVFSVKPEGSYLVGSEYADYGCVNSLYQKLLKYIEKNGLKICGNAYEEYLIDEISEEDSKKYLLHVAIKVNDL